MPRLFHVHKKTARENLWLLRFKICFVKVRRIEEIRDIDIQALAYLMDQTELDRIIGAIHDVSGTGDGSLSHTLSCYKNQLTAYDGQPITYDAIGNPISYRGWSFTWQGGRQLASASNGTTSLSFVYNESGLRTEKTVGNTSHLYVYRGSTLVAEITGDYALYFHHDANGEIVGFTYVSGNTEAEYFYRKNLQGDIIGIVDSTGASVAEYRYDAWGQILSATSTMASVNPIRYRGYYFDQETGLYYLQSRYYDPVVGRFINGDAFASTGKGILGANMFAYCENDPVNCKDSCGKFLEWLFWLKDAYDFCCDLYYIFRADDSERVYASRNEDGSIRINNSYRIKTSTVRYCYSIYLDYFSEYRDDIGGTALGVAFEWLFHNLAYDGLSVLEFFGADVKEKKESAQHADVGYTIFSDKHKLGGVVMKVSFCLLHPISAIIDGITALSQEAK